MGFNYSIVGFLLLGGLLLFQSCSSKLYQPLPEYTTANLTYEQLVDGRKLYVNKCGSCHSLYLPQHYSEKIWFHNLDEMQERAKMSDAEKKLIADYLVYGLKLAGK